MERIKILDRYFTKFIPAHEIQEAIKKVAEQMNNDLKDKDVVFLGILNGSFMFAADLYKQLSFYSIITFLKVASYQGTTSSGNVRQLIGINEDIKGKTVVIIEDIIDTGITIDNITRQLVGFEPKEILVATFLLKPDALKKDVKIDYVGMKIPNDFIVGYGLDYDGYGRNLADIYKVE